MQVTLQDATEQGGVVPNVVLLCTKWIEDNGLDERGIYQRTPSNPAGVTDLLKWFLTGSKNPNLGRVQDIHEVSGCLKRFLLRLESPVLTHQKYDELIRAGHISRDCERMRALIDVLKTLPVRNFHTLKRIIDHLNAVAARGSSNGMTVHQLALLFAPLLMWTEDTQRSAVELPTQAKVCHVWCKPRRSCRYSYLNPADWRVAMAGIDCMQ